MKKTSFSAMMVLACIFCYAQSPKKMPAEIYPLKIISIPGDVIAKQPVFLNKTTTGSVYALPLDNMHCLVTDVATIAAMPVLKTQVEKITIPNALKKEDFVFTNSEAMVLKKPGN